MNSKYPNILQSFGLFGVYMIAALGMGFVFSAAPVSVQNVVGMTLTNCLVIAFALQFKNEGFSYLFEDRQSIRLVMIPIVIIFNLAFIVVVDTLVSLIPMPDFFVELMEKMLQKGIWTYITVAFIAPITEELIFRKIIFDGLLKNYGKWKAILWSAFFFALFHLNPWQGISGFLIGIFLAWLFYHTRNIWLCIFIHFFNNTISYLAFHFSGDIAFGVEDLVGAGQMFWAVIGGALVALFVCIRFLQKEFQLNIDT